jgi:hypothetical protein
LELGFFYPDIEIQDSFSKDFLLFNSRWNSTCVLWEKPKYIDSVYLDFPYEMLDSGWNKFITLTPNESENVL